jgi:hypothetical protein
MILSMGAFLWAFCVVVILYRVFVIRRYFIGAYFAAESAGAILGYGVQ